mmetsp:Transcript_31545/g.66799  ORF Transcript_31545/g.66799 Transcript_31545/m.66799 type:complete len:127 (+) Transcript_31545:754-1134(+)
MWGVPKNQGSNPANIKGACVKKNLASDAIRLFTVAPISAKVTIAEFPFGHSLFLHAHGPVDCNHACGTKQSGDRSDSPEQVLINICQRGIPSSTPSCTIAGYPIAAPIGHWCDLARSTCGIVSTKK